MRGCGVVSFCWYGADAIIHCIVRTALSAIVGARCTVVQLLLSSKPVAAGRTR